MDISQALTVKSLYKQFGSGENAVSVIRNLDFSMKQGAFEAIMGPSGAGKSTFLHLVAGLLSADSGSIIVGGREIVGMSDKEVTLFRRRHIGLVFQDFNLIPTLTAEENIALPLLLDGAGNKNQDRIEQLINVLGLSHRRKHFPDKLSGGERQRVAIARALAGNPDIVLADEPSGNLDSPAAKSLCELLRRLNGELGSTILVVSHDPIVAASTERVHILGDGAFWDSFNIAGDAALVTSRYLNAMTRSAEEAR